MPRQIKQIFFDCDNTLVLSEDVAFEPTSGLVNRVLADHGINKRYTPEELIIDFVGHSFRSMMSLLEAKFDFTITPDEYKYYVDQEELAVIEQLVAKAEPTSGSMEVLEQLHTEKNYGMAVVSSSAIRRIHAAIQRTDQAKFFANEHVFSAVSSLTTPASKPSPAVYNFAMNRIGVKPENCVAVEDSKSGACSAIGANIPCIAYVGAYQTKAKQDEVARTLKAAGCKVIMHHFSQFFNCIAQIQAMD